MGKKSVGILIGVAAVAAVLGGTGYYFRDDIRQMIPSALLKKNSFESSSWVEPMDFTSNLSSRLRSLYTQ